MRSIIHAARRAFVSMVVVLLACGGSTAPGSPLATTPTNPSNPTNPGGNTGGNNARPTVTVSNNAFTPEVLNVAVGTTVNFKWDSCMDDGYGYSTCTSHTVTFTDGMTSEMLSSGTFTRTFTTAGTYAYKCQVHGIYMTGSIVVK